MTTTQILPAGDRSSPASPASILCVAMAVALASAMMPSFVLAAGGDAARDARDAEAVNEVRLDMDLATRVAGVGMQAQEEILGSCLFDDKQDQGLIACADSLSDNPRIRAALDSQRLTGRQFALGFSALVSAQLGSAIIDEEGESAGKLLAEYRISPGHVHFYREHRDDIDRLFETIGMQ